MSSEQQAQDALARMRDRIATQGVRKTPRMWQFPAPDDFALGSVLAFDQTLTKTGFALVRHEPGAIWVVEGNLLKPAATDQKGFEETYAKCFTMEQAIGFIVLNLWHLADVIVHEMPAVHGHRTESSLIAGYFVRKAAKQYAPDVPVRMISNVSMKSLLLPEGQRGEKADVTMAVNDLIEPQHNQAKRWNQDIHDAVALGLTELHQRAKEQS